MPRANRHYIGGYVWHPQLNSLRIQLTGVGSEAFVSATEEKLEVKAKKREVINGDASYELRESPALYEAILGHENGGLRLPNEYFRNDNH